MQISSEVKAQDGTRKFLIELDDKLRVESVLITHKRTLCACVSTQVGCPVKCTFCATGKMGFSRNLSAEEILGQLNLMQKAILPLCPKELGVISSPSCSCEGEETSRRPERPEAVNPAQKITNIVFMGMGEPLLNYDNVVSAVNELRKQSYSWQKITVSSVGIPDKIRQLGKDTQCQLAVSLHAPNDNIRNKLVPINQRFPIKDVLDACKEFPFSKHGPLMVEYILIANVNDKLEHAKELAELLKPFKHVVINLILCNPVVFSPPSAETAKAFKQCLIDAGYKTIIRTTKGVDIKAACGMLVTESNLRK